MENRLRSAKKKQTHLRRTKNLDKESPSTRSALLVKYHTRLLKFLAENRVKRKSKFELKEECVFFGLKKSGTRDQLIQRLDDYVPVLKNRLDWENGEPTSPGIAGDLMDRMLHSSSRIKTTEIVLWRNPLLALKFFLYEFISNVKPYYYKLLKYHQTSIFIGFLFLCCWVLMLHLDGPHQSIISWTQELLVWCLYWLGLGILSSIGLGSGLHTFLLYLGPHIAKVTIAAYECGALNFPEPPYPERMLCPYYLDPDYLASVWNIIWKVKLEAVMWGIGTALGELPPYFVAKASRLSECTLDSDINIHAGPSGLDQCNQNKNTKMSVFDLMKALIENFVHRMKTLIEKFVHKVGFFGILACASIPNPLFDLAGITCGHCLVPFWTFFLATLIGKAIIKIFIQLMAVIVAFNESLITTVITWIANVPLVGGILQGCMTSILESEKNRLHNPNVVHNSIISEIFGYFVFIMILYFLVSVVNSMAQNYHKRIYKQVQRAKNL